MSHKGDYNPQHQHRLALIIGTFTAILIVILLIIFIVRQTS